MKTLRKDALIEKDQVEHTKTEKMIMEHINHPFMVNLEFAFSSPDRIHFVMQYMRGGELFYHLKESRKFPESRTRFYSSQILLALEHLHSKNIIYRDLKPENILMDDYGNVCLTDFGMAK
jgi:serum/glucocorticoid-regulated kinase 2